MIGAFQSAILSSGEDAKVYATWSSDPLRLASGLTLSNGDLTVTNSSATSRCAYLTVDKTSGLWAFSLSSTVSGAKTVNAGVADNLHLGTASIGTFANSIGYYMNIGMKRMTGVANAANYWDTVTDTTAILIVFDATNRKLLSIKSGVLVASETLTGSGQLYIGASLFDNDVGTLAVTLNSGQSALPGEAAMAAYESANSVTINRGLWA